MTHEAHGDTALQQCQKTTGVVLDTWFPHPEVGTPPHNFDSHLLPAHISALEGEDAIRDVNLQGSSAGDRS